MTIDGDVMYRAHKSAVDHSDVVLQMPRSSMWGVLEVAMEYDLASLPVLIEPKVLDIGANVGIFAIACVQCFPGARVMSFEPHPETFKLLKNNVQGLPVEVHEAAVVGWERKVELHEGARNRLCCSILDVGDQDMGTSIPVPTFVAAELPACDVLKVDTEGCEVEILESYRHLGSVKVMMCELHGATPQAVLEQAEQVAKLAHKAGLQFKDQRANTVRYVRHA